jgi:hypothetical protein
MSGLWAEPVIRLNYLGIRLGRSEKGQQLAVPLVHRLLLVCRNNGRSRPAICTHTFGQNWTFSYKSNLAPEGAANVNIYAAFLRLAIPIKPTKLEPKRHTAGHTSF